jgi:hypothetical protein
MKISIVLLQSKTIVSYNSSALPSYHRRTCPTGDCDGHRFRILASIACLVFRVRDSFHTTECRLSLDLDRLQVGCHAKGAALGGRMHLPVRGEWGLRRSHFNALAQPWGLRIMSSVSIAERVFLVVLIAKLCRAARASALF